MSLLIPSLILVPLVAGVALLMAGNKGKSLIPLGVGASVLTLALSVLLMFQVRDLEPSNDVAGVAPRIVFSPDAFRFSLPISAGNYAIEWRWIFGADGISALLVLLTGLVGCITVVLATKQVENRLSQYMGLLLVTISMLMGVFLAMDLVSFYIFFEAVLIPLILLINGWGNGDQPMVASKKFLLFTLAGSIPMVIGFIALAMSPVSIVPGVVSKPSTISLPQLSQYAAEAVMASTASSMNSQLSWIVWLLLLGFGIKLAILPLHTWLPTTYAAAHPNTTALIASVVAKLGLYGIVRIVAPLTPVALAESGQLVFGTLGAIVIVYGALCALVQVDLRNVLAYSSLSHVGFITLGLMSMTAEGLAGATLQMFNHGVITAAMFWILAMLEQRRGRIRMTVEDRGMAARYPKLAVLLVFFTLAGAGLPGLNGFVGEILAMTGMMRVSGTLVTIAVLGTVLGAWYGLRIVQRLLFGGEAGTHAHGHVGHTHGHHAGNHHTGHAHHVGHGHHGDGHDEHHRYQPGRDDDLSPIEWIPLAGVALVCLLIGLTPQRAMDLFQSDTDRLARICEPATKRAHPDIDTLALQNADASQHAVVASR